MSTDENKRTLERFDALLGADDISDLDLLCTPDMVNHALAPDRPAGLAGTREFLESVGRRSFMDHRWDELIVVSEGSYVVQFGKRGGSWPGGAFLGVEAPPGEYSRD